MALKHRVGGRTLSPQNKNSFSRAKKKRIDFLRRFSEKEWTLNGHDKKELNSIFGIYESLLSLANEGECLELGCGTGILCKYIHSFSSGEIKPFGVDKDYSKIRIARKNNKKLKDNFIVGDYFGINGLFLKKFSTIIIFVGTSEEEWSRLFRLLLDKFQEIDKKCTVAIFCYEIEKLMNYYPKENPKFIIFWEEDHKQLSLLKDQLGSSAKKNFVRGLVRYFFAKDSRKISHLR